MKPLSFLVFLCFSIATYSQWIENVQTQKNEYQSGEIVTISTEITDLLFSVLQENDQINVSNIIKFSDAISPSGNTYPVVLQSNNLSKTILHSVVVPPYSEPGIYTIKTIEDLDVNLEFTIKNNHVDTIPPVISNIYAEKEVYGLGNTAKFYADITDNISGFQFQDIDGDLRDENYTLLRGINTTGVSGNTVCFEFDIPKDFETGTQYFMIEATDQAGNQTIMDTTIRAEFTIVDDPELNTTPLEITAIEFGAEQYEIGDQIELNITTSLNANPTNIEHIIVSLSAYEGFNLESKFTLFNKNQNYHTFLSEPLQGISATSITLSSITSLDISGKLHSTREFNPSFEIINNINTDFSAPKIEDISFSKETYTAGEDIILTATITDERSGIGELNRYSFRNTNYNYIKHIYLSGWANNNYTVDGDKYTITIPTSKFQENGIYKLDHFEVLDKMSNRGSRSWHKSTFTITGGVPRVQAPTIENIAIKGNTITFSITNSSTDIHTAIYEFVKEGAIKLGYSTNDLKRLGQEVKFNRNIPYYNNSLGTLKQSGMNHMTTINTENWQKGEWTLQKLWTLDDAGNISSACMCLLDPITLTVDDNPITSIDYQQTNSLKVYPNPSNGQFRLELKDLQIDKIEISDLLGTVVEEINPQSKKTIELHLKLDKGIYIIKSYSGKSYHSNKITIY